MKKKSNNISKKTDKLIKIINYILLIIMCVGSFSLMIYRVSQGRFGRVPTDIAIYFVLLIPAILKRFIKMKLPIGLFIALIRQKLSILPDLSRIIRLTEKTILLLMSTVSIFMLTAVKM